MFVPCIAKSSINNQHYALNYIKTLFNIQVPTCFGSSLQSSGSFLDQSELLEMQIVYTIYSGTSVYKRLSSRTNRFTNASHHE
jgi:hypothetical protein